MLDVRGTLTHIRQVDSAKRVLVRMGAGRTESLSFEDIPWKKQLSSLLILVPSLPNQIWVLLGGCLLSAPAEAVAPG